MPLTDAEIEAVALKEFPKADVISIDGRYLRPTPQQVIGKWSRPQTLARYGEAKPARLPKPTAHVKLRKPQQSPPVPESLLHHTLLIDRESGKVLAQSG